MVFTRCKMLVKSELEKLGLKYTHVELGEIQLEGDIFEEQLGQLKTALEKSGLKLIGDKRSMIIEKIKAS